MDTIKNKLENSGFPVIDIVTLKLCREFPANNFNETVIALDEIKKALEILAENVSDPDIKIQDWTTNFKSVNQDGATKKVLIFSATISHIPF